MDCSTPGFPVHHQLPELTQTHVHRIGDAIQPSHHLSSPLLPPSIFPSIRVFSSESVLWIRWPEYWSFSFSISPSNEYSELISFRMDWLDLLAVQGTLKESSPTPQFKIINSLVLSFLYGPTLTSIHDCFSSGLPKGLSGKKQTNKQTNKQKTPASAGDAGSIPGSGRSPEVGNGNPFQYSCLGNLKDGGACQATVYGVAQSWTWLNMHALLKYSIAPGGWQIPYLIEWV